MTTRKDYVAAEKIVFVAEDGKEFSDEKDCRYYESSLAYSKACEAYDKLRRFDACPPYGEDEDDGAWTWIYLVDAKDLETVKAVLYDDDCIAMDHKLQSYPCWVAFAHNGDGYGGVIGTISDFRENMLHYIDDVIEKQHKEMCKQNV